MMQQWCNGAILSTEFWLHPSQCLPEQNTPSTYECLKCCLSNGLSSPYPLPKIWTRKHGKWLCLSITPVLYSSIYITPLVITTFMQCRMVLLLQDALRDRLHPSQQASMQATPSVLASVQCGQVWKEIHNTFSSNILSPLHFITNCQNMLYLSLTDFSCPSWKKSNTKKKKWKRGNKYFSLPCIQMDWIQVGLPKVLPPLFMAICSSI